MYRYYRNATSVITLIILSSNYFLTAFSGCKRQKYDRQKFIFDLALSSLTDTVNKQKSSDTSDIGKRAKDALSKLKNGVLDTDPIILHASIGLVEPNDEPSLFLLYFDEDSDLRGLCIKEEYFDPNGMKRALEEDYPIFVNALDTLIYENIRFPVVVRDKYQRKDEFLWLEYVKRNLDALIRKYIDNQQHDSKDTFTRGVPWGEEEMPPIYISVPDPNRVKVLVSIYDRAGNESDSVELLATPYIRSVYLR
jgi:hypothetical protein